MDVRTEEDADVAALITADADAIMAADVITDVDVTVDGDFQAEIIPAAIFSGSSSFCACAETITVDAAIAAVDAETVTIAGSLSYCFCCAEIMAADVDADDHCLPAEGIFPLPFYILPGNGPAVFLFRMHCLATLFFLFHTLQIYLIKSISIHNKLFFLFF